MILKDCTRVELVVSFRSELQKYRTNALPANTIPNKLNDGNAGLMDNANLLRGYVVELWFQTLNYVLETAWLFLSQTLALSVANRGAGQAPKRKTTSMVGFSRSGPFSRLYLKEK